MWDRPRKSVISSVGNDLSHVDPPFADESEPFSEIHGLAARWRNQG